MLVQLKEEWGDRLSIIGFTITVFSILAALIAVCWYFWPNIVALLASIGIGLLGAAYVLGAICTFTFVLYLAFSALAVRLLGGYRCWALRKFIKKHDAQGAKIRLGDLVVEKTVVCGTCGDEFRITGHLGWCHPTGELSLPSVILREEVSYLDCPVCGDEGKVNWLHPSDGPFVKRPLNRRAAAEFGDYLRQCREARGLSVSELAHNAELSCADLSQVEGGEPRSISDEKLKALGKALGHESLPELFARAGRIQPTETRPRYASPWMELVFAEHPRYSSIEVGEYTFLTRTAMADHFDSLGVYRTKRLTGNLLNIISAICAVLVMLSALCALVYLNSIHARG